MRAPGLEADLEQAGRPERLQRVVVRDARLATGDDRKAERRGRMPVDRRVDRAAQRIRMALDQRVVALVDVAARGTPP